MTEATEEAGNGAAESEPLGGYYASTRQRITALVEPLDDSAKTIPVAACPGWSVHDVVAHLVGLIEDASAGRLNGLPSDAQTGEQVMRHREESTRDLLAQWSVLGPPFEQAVSAAQIWPATLDSISHEHDIRTALGRPGFRDTTAVRLGARRFADSIQLPDPSTISVVIDGEAPVVVSADVSPATYELRTTAFEVFRFRVGRRSANQVRSLNWSCDPSPIMDHLFIFGPAAHDLDESAE